MKTVDMAKDAIAQIRLGQIATYTCDSERQAHYVAKNIRQLLREMGLGGTMTVTQKENVLYIGEKQPERDPFAKYKTMIRKLLEESDPDKLDALYDEANLLLEAE